jgi:hypothetical protein
MQAIQVHSVFNQFCPALGLRVETAIGQHSFAAEQAKLNAPISADAPQYVRSRNAHTAFRRLYHLIIARIML